MILKFTNPLEYGQYITWLLVVITFVLGFIISNYQTNRKDKKELNSLFEYFNLYLKSQKRSFGKQINAFKEYVHLTEKLTPFGIAKIEFYIQPYEMIEVIDKIKLVQSFKLNNVNDEKAVKILTTISLFKENINITREAHNSLILRQNGLLEQWNTEIMLFNQVKSDLLNIPKSDIISIPELVILNDVYNKLVEINTPDPKVQFDTCLLPLKNYFQLQLDENHLNKYALALFPRLSKLDRLYYESLDLYTNHLNYLQGINSLLEEKLVELTIGD